MITYPYIYNFVKKLKSYLLQAMLEFEGKSARLQSYGLSTFFPKLRRLSGQVKMEDGRKCIKKVPVINVITELKLGRLDRREQILTFKVILNQVTGHLSNTIHPSQGPL